MPTHSILSWRRILVRSRFSRWASRTTYLGSEDAYHLGVLTITTLFVYGLPRRSLHVHFKHFKRSRGAKFILWSHMVWDLIGCMCINASHKLRLLNTEILIGYCDTAFTIFLLIPFMIFSKW
ncbi:hypothetical protein F5Y16DRAFT_302206 [Xylariaceae sp. FL0255]|nr:hypothetical protein F5Y16DRAFT_302206 [Xylariaceae sp. FL0255]